MVDMPHIDKKYYTGANLLSQMDENGQKPGIFLSNSNRSAGKTSYFQIYCLQGYLLLGEKFLMICRKKAELKDIHVSFMDMLSLYFDNAKMNCKWFVDRLVMGLYYEGKICGYAISLKDANDLKKYSAIFKDVTRVMMDELQPETGGYLKNEIDLFESVVQTVSRGGGKQSRYIEWLLLSNNISVMNPYFINLGIYNYIDDSMNIKAGEDFYIKGDGWVSEFSFNESAKSEMEVNPAIRAFNSRNSILGLTADFMIKSGGFITKKMSGKMQYLWTLKYKGEKMGVRKYVKDGKPIIYITSSFDPSFKDIVSLSDSDHEDCTVMIRKNTFYMQVMRDAYVIGGLRFSDVKVKNAIVELLGIDYYK